MIDLELRFDATTTVRLDAEVLPVTTATLAVYAPDGSTLEAPTVTKPTVATAIADGATNRLITVASVTGIAIGDRLGYFRNGVLHVITVSEINTLTIKTVQPVAQVPLVGAILYGMTMSAPVSALGATKIGGNYRLGWTYSDGTTTRVVSQGASVVRWPFDPPARWEDVREIVQEIGGGARLEAWCGQIAGRVNNKIEAKLAQTGRRPWLYLGSQVFADIARSGIRYELSLQGIALGQDIYAAQRELRFAFDDGLTELITSLQGYDKNGDGKIDASEAKRTYATIQVTR